MERLTATLAEPLASDFARFKKTPGGTGTRFVGMLGAKAATATKLGGRVNALEAEDQRLRDQLATLAARTAAPDLQQLRADYAREAADFEAERDSWRRERAIWADRQAAADDALQATARETARLQAELDTLRESRDSVVQALVATAADAFTQEIDRRVGEKAWALLVRYGGAAAADAYWRDATRQLREAPRGAAGCATIVVR